MKRSYTDTLIAFLMEKPGLWVDGMTLATIGGIYAWRSRVSDARRKLQAEGLGTIENEQRRQPNGSVVSVYRFVYAKEQRP